MDKAIKNINSYIEALRYAAKSCSANCMTVEHRQNNPKRDYLFVNRFQCKHIPSSPSKMLNMCEELADKVKVQLEENDKVLIIGFAETATAIGHAVASYLDKSQSDNGRDAYCLLSMHTTRENTISSNLVVTFEEIHSHATTQKLITYNDDRKLNFDDFTYILFVEDEISTGNTILNFINALRNKGINKKYGVASFCNWQSREDRRKFIDEKVDTFALIYGQMKLATNTMEIDKNEIITAKKTTDMYGVCGPRDNLNILGLIDEIEYRISESNEFEEERLGRIPNKKNDELALKGLLKALNLSEEYNSIRIIGTEEFMYQPILLGKLLEDSSKLSINKVICHSTTRSSIDVLNSDFDNEEQGIKNKLILNSPYDITRKTYLYNIDDKTDLTIVMTDTLNDIAYTEFKRDIIDYLIELALEPKTKRIIFVRCK